MLFLSLAALTESQGILCKSACHQILEEPVENHIPFRVPVSQFCPDLPTCFLYPHANIRINLDPAWTHLFTHIPVRPMCLEIV